MFIDQEQKIHPVRKWIMRLLKIGVFLAIMLAIFVTVLANMGGSTVTLKEAAQKFIGESFGGRPAVIQKLVRLSFFPLVGIDAEKIQVTNPIAAGSTEPGAVVALFSKVKIYLDFWDVALGTARFRTFLIEEGFLGPGLVGDKSMSLERAYVDHNEHDNTAMIVANGLYDNLEWKLGMGLDVLGALGQYEYEIGDRTPFALDVDNMHISGDLLKSSDNFMKIEGFRFERDGKGLRGDLYASLIAESVVKLKGDLIFNGNNTQMVSVDLLINFKDPLLRISGDINGGGFSLAEVFQGEQSTLGVFSRAYNIFRHSPPDQDNAQILGWMLSAIDYDINFDLKDVVAMNSKKASWTMRVRQKDGDLVLEDVKGKIDQTDFNVPVLAVLHSADDAGKSKIMVVAAVEGIKSDVFGIVDDKPSVKGIPSDGGAEKGCMTGSLFDDGKVLLPSKVEYNPEAGSIPLSVTDYLYLTSVFDSKEGKTCSAALKQVEASSGTNKP